MQRTPLEFLILKAEEVRERLQREIALHRQVAADVQESYERALVIWDKVVSFGVSRRINRE